jgi:hypothetical protein
MNAQKMKEKKKRRREAKARKQMLKHREHKFFYDRWVIHIWW